MSRYNRGARSINRIDVWRVTEIVRETPTMFEVLGIGHYDRMKKKGEVLQRFATMEEAQAFIDAAKTATADLKAAAEAARIAYNKAQEAQREADRALQAATVEWVKAQGIV